MHANINWRDCFRWYTARAAAATAQRTDGAPVAAAGAPKAAGGGSDAAAGYALAAPAATSPSAEAPTMPSSPLSPDMGNPPPG